jgi:hypothetical protein
VDDSLSILTLLRTISAISNALLPPLYSIPSLVIPVVIAAVIEILVYTSIYEPFSPLISLYAFDFRFSSFIYNFSGFGTSLPSPLFDSKPSDLCGSYSSYKGSGTHFDLRFPSLRFTVPSSPIYGSFLSDFRLTISLYTFRLATPPG